MRFIIINRLFILSLILLYSTAAANNLKVKGRILDKLTGKGISYAVIRDINNTKAVTSNSEGDYIISVNRKNNILIFSSVGYNSDTVCLSAGILSHITNIYLLPSDGLTKLSDNTSQKYSAYGLITEVLAVKMKMYSKINNYQFKAYNRFITRENDAVGIGTGSININEGIFGRTINLFSNIWESKPLKIDGINEFWSKGYYFSPSSYREIIETPKEHSRIPSSLNELLGTRRIQNLCGEKLEYYNHTFPAPLSSDALNYYKYYFEDTLTTNNDKIYQVYFEPVDKNDPGLTGYLYIDGNDYHIVKVTGSLNQNANSGNLFENVSITQQFIRYGNGLYLPLDYRIAANSNYIGMVKINYELNSFIGDYLINSNKNVSHDPDAVLTFLPADGKHDSLFQSDNETVPLTHQEALAYAKINSRSSFHKGFFYEASRIISRQYRLSDHFSISGPLDVYQFNHVEGNTINLNIYGNDLFNNTTWSKLNLSHGFADKRSKGSLDLSFYPYKDRSIGFTFTAYNKIAMLFASANRYRSFTSTIYSLLSSRDIRNFYYTNGFDVGIEDEVTSFMNVNAVYSNHMDHSAQTNTTFSLLGTRRHYSSNSNFTFPDSVNPPIYDARLNTLSLGINFDFRNEIIENNIMRKVSDGHSFLTFGAGVLISSPKYLESNMNFISYSANVLGEINTYKTSSLSFEINAIYSDGPVPLQMQYALPGNIGGTSRNFTFRTVGVGNIFGDQTLTLNLEYNIRKEIYRLIPISILRSLSLNTFFNAAWKNMSAKSAAIMPIPYSVLTKPLMETGFSIGYLSLPVSLEFAWRLTHIDRRSFSVGLNTSIL